MTGIAIEFEVIGHPATQGSKRVVPIYRKGKVPVIKDGRVLTRAIEDNPKTCEWRQEVAQQARKAYDGPLIECALRVEMTFIRPRPKGHFGVKGLLDRAPRFPTQRPDTIKLTRAIEDGLTGVIWRDDSQIVTHILTKRFGESFRVHVKITEESA